MTLMTLTALKQVFLMTAVVLVSLHVTLGLPRKQCPMRGVCPRVLLASRADNT